MKILVVGSGGREHAICWRLKRSDPGAQIFCAPGNPGTASCGTNVPIAAGQITELLAFARQEGVDLTVVGPEAPLCAGIRERFEAEGLLLAGPTAAAAQLEGSKAHAKAFMTRHGIPTAPSETFVDAAAAAAYIDAHPEALIVKADGLAAGKGVFVCSEGSEAKVAVERLLGGALGDAGKRVVVEHKLSGEEASYIVLTDGERICPLASSQDHKAVHDGDQGPNTGGMGAYSPAPVLSPELEQHVMREIVEPTVAGLAEEGTPYMGFLYVGLMIDEGRPSVLEYNCRMGDPETQPLMARLDDDLVGLLHGMARGELPKTSDLRWDPRAAICVVLAAAGYPNAYDKGLPIEGLGAAKEDDDVVVFHAGTAEADGRLVTAGGRVLGVTALGIDLVQARQRVYGAIEAIRWEGLHYRRDIGHRALTATRARD
jgi:phosphoribosylamine--glycine ligase